jgi:hypothetical protein
MVVVEIFDFFSFVALCFFLASFQLSTLASFSLALFYYYADCCCYLREGAFVLIRLFNHYDNFLTTTTIARGWLFNY